VSKTDVIEMRKELEKLIEDNMVRGERLRTAVEFDPFILLAHKLNLVLQELATEEQRYRIELAFQRSISEAFDEAQAEIERARDNRLSQLTIYDYEKEEEANKTVPDVEGKDVKGS